MKRRNSVCKSNKLINHIIFIPHILMNKMLGRNKHS